MERGRVLEWLHSFDYLAKLKEYIAIPSIGSQKADVGRTRDFAVQLLEDLGMQVKTYPTSGNDIILATYANKSSNPTILIYGHYDVQAIGNPHLWKSPPFAAEVRNNKLYGRGVADNKGQHYAHMLALQYLREHHSEIFEHINIKFILDGDEESGSFSLSEVIPEHEDDFAADFAFVSDGPSLSYTQPSIVGSVRGVLAFQVTISHNASDLHSGNFGGLARSATRDLISLLNAMVDENGKSKIPGFYDNVAPPSTKEQTGLLKLHEHYQTIIEQHNLTLARTFDNLSVYEQNQMYPTFNINGLHAGTVGADARTIIPQSATASIDIRTIPNLQTVRLEKLIKDFIHKWAVEHDISESALSISFEAAMGPIKSSINAPAFDLVADAVAEGFATDPLIVPRLGGSLPLYLFDEYLDIPVVLVPYALPDEYNHAPNENLDIPFFESGVVATVILLLRLANSS